MCDWAMTGGLSGLRVEALGLGLMVLVQCLMGIESAGIKMVVSMTTSRIHVMIECLCGRGADIVRRHGHCDPSIVRASVAALAIKEYLITDSTTAMW